MSSLWNVSVINKGKDWVDLAVSLDHPDAGAFPEDPTFALCLLTQEAYGFDSKYNYIPTSALGEQIPHDRSYQPHDLEERVKEFIVKTTIYETQNCPFDEYEAHRRTDEEVVALGFTKDSQEWENAWQDKWRDFWSNPNNLPSAKYRIWVTDPKWIAHLTVGQSFDSAAYSEHGPWINDNRSVLIEVPADAVARKAVAGFNSSEVPPRSTEMNAELIRSMAQGNTPFTNAEIQEALNAHFEFLNSGGAGGRFERLHVAGLPLNIYLSNGSKGKHLEWRHKLVAKGSSITNADLSFADLSGCICEGVNFSGSKFNGALLTDSFFSAANFEGAIMQGADFTGCDLTNASFKNADLRNADFEIANCEGADFTGAKLEGARFPGANLNNIKR
ncbi:MAG: pentapeptide repeat-containing protein [Chitinophagales bacterium]